MQKQWRDLFAFCFTKTGLILILGLKKKKEPGNYLTPFFSSERRAVWVFPEPSVNTVNTDFF
ncbi:hypothetical protein FH5T_01360 [Draconibacterium orientale]|uniref:Uncharacterized protein n=1 Tax=Draconibacterium orientale TaxID=1168034 RepID=A0ABN4D1C5_9BACT|nr:hypothetical protein FH5T_01360 [Draconibacterium orientale]